VTCRWLAAAALAAGCAAPVAQRAQGRVPFGPDERDGELAFLRDTLRAVYAHLEVKRRDFGVDLDDLYARHRAAARAADTWTRYERVMVAFVSELHDGHLVWRRRRGPTERRMRIVRVGLDARFVGDALVVTGVWPGSAAEAAGLAAGDRIVAIDGQTVDRRFERYASLRSWSTSAAARYDFAEEWPASRIAAGAAAPVRRLRRDDGIDVAVAAEDRPRPGPRAPPLAVDDRDGTIVVTVRALDVARDELARAVDDLARRVRAGARGVVVDLRGNGGGRDQTATAIAGAVSPVAVVGGYRRVRLSPQARAARAEWRDLPEDPDRPGWSYALPLATAGGGVDPGRVAALIDAGCRSACEQLALLLRAAGARLIGETTGGSSGAPIAVTLPRSGAWVDIPAWSLTSAAGEPIEGHGVAPDEVLAPTRADLAAGRDAVLARGLAWVTLSTDAPPPGHLLRRGRDALVDLRASRRSARRPPG
jgi:C-terminal processing protease CtpA/Prc